MTNNPPETNLSNHGENPTCVLAQRVVDAAKVYYERYAQDEVNDAQDGWNCTGCSDKQSADAVELRNALAALAAGPDARLVAPQPMPAIPTGWQPIETAPEHGYIYVQQAATYRWLPYKPNSQEWKRGKKGRWQKHTGYGFDNAELEGTGWMPVPPTPPPQGEPS